MEQAIALEHFKAGDSSGYRAYRGVKFQVFVAEQGWHSLKEDSGEPVAKEDPFDVVSSYVLAKTLDGAPVGVVRGTALKDGFPRERLFEHHLRRGDVRRLRPVSCTLNALAVLPAYRCKGFRVQGSGWKGTAAQLLMLAIISDMEAEGIRAVIATSSSLPSTRLCASLGFQFMDPPTGIVFDGRRRMCFNVALLCGSDSHVRAQEACGMTSRRTDPGWKDPFCIQGRSMRSGLWSGGPPPAWAAGQWEAARGGRTLIS